MLPFREARDEEDERHVHPLQLDVIDRALVLWLEPGRDGPDAVHGRRVGGLLGGSCQRRRGIGVELKPSYYRQAVKNVAAAALDPASGQLALGATA